MKLNEIVQKINDTVKIEQFCSKYNIEKYTITKDFKIDVDGDVYIQNFRMKQLPIKFGIVKGYFSIANSKQLINLEGCPDEVHGDFFSASHSKNLVSLKGAPKIVKGAFAVVSCPKLIEFGQQLPEQVKIFSVYSCDNLISLKGSPKRVTEDFNCAMCPSLKSFESELEFVGGDFLGYICHNVETFSGLPSTVLGKLNLNGVNKPLNALALFQVDGCKEIEIYNSTNPQITSGSFGDKLKVHKLINKYYHDNQNVAACQEALIDAGLEEYATF